MLPGVNVCNAAGLPPPLGSNFHWKSSSEGLRMSVLLRENVHLCQTDHFELQSIENCTKTASLILLPFSHSKWTMEASWHVQTFPFFNFFGFNAPLGRLWILHFVQLFKPFLLHKLFDDGQHVQILTFVCFHVSSTSFSCQMMADKWSISIDFLFKSSHFHKLIVFPKEN